jgi:hypothetical protein
MNSYPIARLLLGMVRWRQCPIPLEGKRQSRAAAYLMRRPGSESSQIHRERWRPPDRRSAPFPDLCPSDRRDRRSAAPGVFQFEQRRSPGHPAGFTLRGYYCYEPCYQLVPIGGSLFRLSNLFPGLTVSSARASTMIRLLWIVVYLFSLAIALMCGLAAITILAAIVTGKLADPEAWKTAVFLAAIGCLLWFLSRAAWRLSE